MTVTKRIVCLANSRKRRGFCVAGREIDGSKLSGWVRPVSGRPDEEVSRREQQYGDGTCPGLLDVIDVPLLEPRPKAHQPENWLLDPGRRWVRVGRVAPAALAQVAEEDGTLWLNGYDTHAGRNDRVPLSEAASAPNSLKTVHVPTMQLRVFTPQGAFADPTPRVQARFRFAGHDYALSVTDPVIEREYLVRRNGDYEVGESYLTISLGDPYEGYCYKLVAAVIPAA